MSTTVLVPGSSSREVFVDDLYIHEDVEGQIHLVYIAHNVDLAGRYEALARWRQCTNCGVCHALYIDPGVVGGP